VVSERLSFSSGGGHIHSSPFIVYDVIVVVVVVVVVVIVLSSES
jgi:hypothetical protein